MIVISDTTPILSLLKAGRLDLLQKLYESVIIPEAVYNELTINPLFKDERNKILPPAVPKRHQAYICTFSRNYKLPGWACRRNSHPV